MIWRHRSSVIAAIPTPAGADLERSERRAINTALVRNDDQAHPTDRISKTIHGLEQMRHA